MRRIGSFLSLLFCRQFVLRQGDIVEYDEGNEGRQYAVKSINDNTFITSHNEIKNKSKILCVFRYRNRKLVKVWDTRKNTKIF
jgi:hypothetical protein